MSHPLPKLSAYENRSVVISDSCKLKNMKTETKTAPDVPALNLSTLGKPRCKSNNILINTSLQRGASSIQRNSTVLTVSIGSNCPSSDGEIKNQKAPKDPYFKAFQTFSKKHPIPHRSTLSDQIRVTF